MSGPGKTAIVTGASQGIGAGLVARFVERGFNVVATSRKVSHSTEVAPSDRVALVDGHIGEPATAAVPDPSAPRRAASGVSGAVPIHVPRPDHGRPGDESQGPIPGLTPAGGVLPGRRERGSFPR